MTTDVIVKTRCNVGGILNASEELKIQQKCVNQGYLRSMYCDANWCIIHTQQFASMAEFTVIDRRTFLSPRVYIYIDNGYTYS